MKKTISLSALMLIFFSSTLFAKSNISVADIQKIDLGDSIEAVTKKIGEPQQVLSKELTTDGKEQIVWLYEVSSVKKQSPGLISGGHVDENGVYHGGSMLFGLINETSESQLDRQRAASLAQNASGQKASPPSSNYILVFTDGKISSVKKQQETPSNTAQISVVNY